MSVNAPEMTPESFDITHDLLNSLTSVHCVSEILRDNPGIDPGQRQRFLGIILSETQRLIGMVDHLPEAAGTWMAISKHG